MQVEMAGRFAKHSRGISLSDALKKTIAEVKLLDVDYSKEPRVDVEKDAAPLSGASPFFWANQILVALPEPPIAPKDLDADQTGEVQPDAMVSPDAVATPLPAETSSAGSTSKVQEPTPQDSPTAVEVDSDEQVEDEQDDDDEGAVWSIGGKKK
jgi:hypothetical protein